MRLTFVAASRLLLLAAAGCSSPDPFPSLPRTQLYPGGTIAPVQAADGSVQNQLLPPNQPVSQPALPPPPDGGQ